MRHLKQMSLHVRASSGSKTLRNLENFNLFLNTLTLACDFNSSGMAFHTFDILTKNEFLKRDVLALILFNIAPDWSLSRVHLILEFPLNSKKKKKIQPLKCISGRINEVKNKEICTLGIKKWSLVALTTTLIWVY